MFLRDYERRLEPQLSSKLGEPILRCVALNAASMSDRMETESLSSLLAAVVDCQGEATHPTAANDVPHPDADARLDHRHQKRHDRLPARSRLADSHPATRRCRADRRPRRRRLVALSPEISRPIGGTGLGTGLWRPRPRRRIGRPVTGILGHTTLGRDVCTDCAAGTVRRVAAARQPSTVADQVISAGRRPGCGACTAVLRLRRLPGLRISPRNTNQGDHPQLRWWQRRHLSWEMDPRRRDADGPNLGKCPTTCRTVQRWISVSTGAGRLRRASRNGYSSGAQFALSWPSSCSCPQGGEDALPAQHIGDGTPARSRRRNRPRNSTKTIRTGYASRSTVRRAAVRR